LAADWQPPGWAATVTLPLALIGCGVSGYLTYEHFSASTTLACPESGVVNCVRVTTSSQAYLLGVPVALLGLLFFIGMAALCLPAVWRARPPALRWLRLTASAAGVAMVIYLVYVELFVLDAICLWCTAVHVLTLLLFAAVAIAMALAGLAEPERVR